MKLHNLLLARVAAMALLLVARNAFAQAPSLGTVAPQNGSANTGVSQTLTFTANYPNAVNPQLWVLISTSPQIGGCVFTLKYNSGYPDVWVNDGTDCQPTIQSASLDANGNFTVAVGLVFYPAWAGTTVYFYESADDLGTGQSSGVWQIPEASLQIVAFDQGPPQLGTITSGTNTSVQANQLHSIGFTAIDPNFWQAINEVDLLISPNHTQTNSCLIAIFPGQGTAYLFSDDLMSWSPAWLGYYTANSQCQVLFPNYITSINNTTEQLLLSVAPAPTLVGANYIDEQVVDQWAASGFGTIGTVTVTPPPTPFITTQSYLTPGQTNTPYSQSLTAVGGTPPYTWSVASGSLPPGMTMSSAGNLSGTPPTNNVYNFDATVRDSGNGAGTKTLTCQVVTAKTTQLLSPLIPVPMPSTKVGLIRSAGQSAPTFMFDSNGNTQGPNPNDSVDRVDGFLPLNGIQNYDVGIVGDWTGDGHAKAGWFRPNGPVWGNGEWFLDANDNGTYDPYPCGQSVCDLHYTNFGGWDGTGQPDVPVIGDWAGIGKDAIGVVHQGFLWVLDLNADGQFQQPTCIGADHIDHWPTSTCTVNATGDAVFPLGAAVDKPVVGNWFNLKSAAGHPISQAAMVRTYWDGTEWRGGPFFWLLDNAVAGTPTNVTQMNAHFTTGTVADFGGAEYDTPVAGDWTNTGIAHLGIFGGDPNFLWVLDGVSPTAGLTGHYAGYNDPNGIVFPYGGLVGDKPVTGKWAPPLTVTTGPNLTATEMVSYSQPLSATGGANPYSWTLTSGTLPPGVTLSSGQISGTPTKAGSYNFTVRVSDSLGNNADQALILTVPLSLARVPLDPSVVNFNPNASYPAPCIDVNHANCTAWEGYIKYYQSNNSLFGEALTYYEGPDSPNATVRATASMIDDLGNRYTDPCSPRSGQFYPNSGANFVLADSVAPSLVPCTVITVALLQPSAIRSYTVTSTHSDSNGSDSSSEVSYFRLVFLAAGINSPTGGAFSNINLPPYYDYTKNITPVVYTAPDPGNQNFALARDGVSANYNGNISIQKDGSGNIISVTAPISVSVPYSANKGRHDIAFPVSNSSDRVPAFSVIVYDATPVITGVSPTKIVSGTPTNLTVTGTGFGDKPKLYIAQSPSACTTATPTNPSVNHNQATGADIVTTSVNWPQANVLLNICLISTGAGGQTFIGAPQAGTSTRGSAQSNTTQVGVPPVITNFSPNPIQIDGTGNPVTFTITGLGFGSGTPSVTFSPATGISVQSVNPTSNNGQTVTGAFLPQTAGSYMVTVTPNGSSQTSGPYPVTLLAGAPTISGVNGNPLPGGIWWFYDGFVPNNGYYDSVQLAVTPGPGGSPPTPSQKATWQDPANPGQVLINCNDPSCSTVTVYARETIPGECPSTSIMVTLAGVPSAATSLTIDSPYFLAFAQAISNPKDDSYDVGGQIGYVSNHTYNVISACGTKMPGPAVNEQFPGLYGQNGAQGRCTLIANNWPLIAQDGQTVWTTNNNNFFGIDFIDTVATFDFPPPNATLVPSPMFGPQNPLLMVPMTWQTQVFRVGSETIGQGVQVQLDYQTTYQDHGRNQGAIPTPCN